MNSVAIIGGGITGLTAAFYLQRNRVPVTVYESSSRPGGVIQSCRRDGYLAESGPNTILETSPKVAELVRDAGLESRRLEPDPKAAKFLVRYRRPIEMPASPVGFFTSGLFSGGAKWALLREPFVAPLRNGPEESIGAFVRRRLGQEFLDYAIDALVAGIYAGDPERLSLLHAFPRLKDLEERYGSLIKGQIFGARHRKQRGEVAKDRAPKFSFDEGLEVLPNKLAESPGANVRLNTTVEGLARFGDEWRLDLSDLQGKCSANHSAVIYAGTAFSLAKLEVQGAKMLDLKPLEQIRYPPVASVVLGFRRQDVKHPCAGFGMLIPRVEGFKILGTIFSSSLFPNRAPEGHVLLTSYVGGERQPELASLPKDKIADLVCEDLKVLLGVTGQPTFVHCAFYPRAIPQYNVGYGKYKELMNEIEKNAPGLFLAGHYREGVSLSDSIVSGRNAADRVERFLANLPARRMEEALK